jgi:hypothetical protein
VLLAAPLSISAQNIRGVIVTRGTEVPVSSALIELLDSTGVVDARGLTDGEGRYALSAPAAGSYRIRVRRIGLRSMVSESRFLGAGETTTLPLSVEAIPVVLPAVQVVGVPQCPSGSRLDAAIGDVWQEVETALLMTDLAREGGLVHVRIERYQRDLASPGGKVIATKTTKVEGDTAALFRSLPADELVRLGFIQKTAGDLYYYAPDVGVLRSDVFIRSHCFTLVPAPGKKQDRVGLSFKPLATDTLPDVRGVLWLDRSSAALVSMEFRYAHAPADVPDDTLIGGRIDFKRLQSGRWVISHWHLRMPLEVVQHRNWGKARDDSGAYYYTLTKYREEGGDLLSVESESLDPP